ncbi:hypothetical protein, conserved [Babesia bigemina]|uniref:CS domain-containing protein n=1 Tax=Babesia bigemina TaxID=5866 RepID=A0A061D7U5_BABBI|nr:hypothetical protein, conserved [Babesia bigemina]CDR93785.1 hypothetical protein, conserved [Babesia bigemina]|eukprot:XP_012765971.1 hypothetical protein, conserved [Babesia bigemina]
MLLYLLAHVWAWRYVIFVGIRCADGFVLRRCPSLVLGRPKTNRLFAAPNDAQPPIPAAADKEVAEKLEKEIQDKIARYMAPMEANNIKGIDQKVLDRNFGELYSVENIKKREQRNARKVQLEPPEVPPTDKLPYFVNMQNPKNPLSAAHVDYVGDVIAHGQLDPRSTVLPHAVCVGVAEQQGAVAEDRHGHLGEETACEVKADSAAAQAGENVVVGGAPSSGAGVEPSPDLDNVRQGRSTPTGESEPENIERLSGGITMFKNTYEELLEGNRTTEFVGDPLDPYFEAAAQQASDDEAERVDSDEEELEKQVWYRTKPLRQLMPKEMADGWSVLPCGRIYKHLLRPSHEPPDKQRVPGQETYVSFGFKIADAFTGEILVEAADAESEGIVTQLKELSPPVQRMLASMKVGEQAEFVCPAIELGLDKLDREGMPPVEWVRVWMHTIMMHERGEKWWHLSPIEASKFPTAKPYEDRRTRMERINLKADELTKQIEHELENNPTSPLWDDVMQRLNEQQKASVVEHFDQKLEWQERRKCAEFSGSRGFGDTIKSTGQVKGYDVGRMSGGSGGCYTWHETPFFIYIAVPVVPGVRAEHVNFELGQTHLTLKVAGKTIIDDDITGPVVTDIATSWAMSEKAMDYEPLPPGHPELEDPVLKTDRDDDYHSIARDPAIIIALKKRDKVLGDWGTPFLKQSGVVRRVHQTVEFTLEPVELRSEFAARRLQRQQGIRLFHGLQHVETQTEHALA